LTPNTYAAQLELGARITEVANQINHELNNGLGRRIKEIQAPTTERVIALERAVFRDLANYRDNDRQ
jgi:hypothetical protein